VRPCDLFSCLQKRCPECGVLKEERRFHGSRTCWDCRKDKPASLTHITASFDLSSFRQFFDHEQIQGSCLSICQRAALITLHQLNIGINQIAELTHCELRTISHWIDYYQEHHSLQDEPRSGRPRVTSEDIDTSIVAAATETPITTPRTIRSELSIDASARTVRRRLDEAGLFGRVARVEYPFDHTDITERLEFAHKHEGWTRSQWGRVMFGDEAYICLGVHGQIWVQRPQDTAYLSQFMVQGQTNFAPKIGIWACFSGQGVAGLRIFDGDMDTRLYTDTMDQFMKPRALRFWPDGPWFYLHDNAGYHGSRGSYTWFHNKGVDLIKLPPHSPDLNPIENLWADLKRRIELRFPRDIAKLRQFLTEEWESTPRSTCSNLVNSMPDRMRAVIDAEGHKTGY